MLVKELVDKDEDMTQYGRTATIKDTYDFILQDFERRCFRIESQ